MEMVGFVLRIRKDVKPGRNACTNRSTGRLSQSRRIIQNRLGMKLNFSEIHLYTQKKNFGPKIPAANYCAKKVNFFDF